MSERDAHLRWTELSRRRLASCAVFDLSAVQRRSADGRTGEFWVLETRDWVNVVPVIRAASGAESFLMVRQYRHGVQQITTEFPAGLMEDGESPAEAAARELREETGWRAGRLTLISSLRPNPAFMPNHCYTFLAEEMERIGAQDLDELESMEIVTLPIEDVDARIGSGELVNAHTVVALAAFHRHRAPRP